MTAMGVGGRVQRENGEAIGAIRTTVNRTERGQRLRALNWVKQLRNELTSAEFALNIDAPLGRINGDPASTGEPMGTGGHGAGGDESGGAGSAIDFDGIAERLESRLRALQAARPLSFLETLPEGEIVELTERLTTNLAKVKKVVQEGRGSGGGTTSASGAGGGIVGGVSGNINVNLKDVKVPEFDLFVREDGTVDWDGAIQSGREVARFGQELWDRINGQNPHEEGGIGGGGDRSLRDLPEDSPVMVSLSAVGAVLEERVSQLQKELDALKAEARAQEASWKTGAERRQAQRGIRDKEVLLNNAERELQLHRIDVDMERICHLIEQDIRESTGTSSSLAENRLLVAEFGLLDDQLANLKRLVSEAGGSGEGDGVEVDAANSSLAVDLDGVAILDEDELELIRREVLDLKNRLGMDLENPALTVDPEKVARYGKETYEKVRSGFDFYWTGTKILGNDVGYALSLVLKAAQGSILKPREVRTLRRTGKDCLTFIPFMVILILPLTPVGHVVIFSVIQRLFPDFFPSSYTERRQNLLKMYTEVEKKVDWEDSDPAAGGDDMLEKLRRNFSLTLNQSGDQRKSNEHTER